MRQAGVMLIIKDGLILGVSRRYDSTKFGLPGGKVEVGETPAEAAIRETWEETGIRVKTCVPIYKRTEPASEPRGEPFYAYAFYASDWTGDPTRSEEGAVKWITANTLTTMGAFNSYNRDTLDSFKDMFPEVYIQGE